MKAGALAAIASLVLGGCGHLVGGPVEPGKSPKGVRYYLPRAQFVVEQQPKDGSVETKVALHRVPDLRSPYHVYLRQGLFSADIFDLEVDEQGLLVGVSTDVTDQGVESVRTVAEFAVTLASAVSKAAVVAHRSRPLLLAAQTPALDLPPAEACRPPSAPVEGSADLWTMPDIKSVVVGLEQFKGRVEQAEVDLESAAKKSIETGGQAFIDARVHARQTLAGAESCLQVFAAGQRAFRNAVKRVIDGDHVGPALDALEKRLAVEGGVKRLGAANDSLALALLDGSLSLSPQMLAKELKGIGADRAAADATSLLSPPPLSPTGLNSVQTSVQAASRQCGGPLAVTVASVAVAVRIMEADLNCLIEATDIKNPLEEGQAALSDILMVIEFALDPSAGLNAAKAKATPAITTGRVTIETRFGDDILLHRLMRARDRIKEFAWRRDDLVHDEKALKKQAMALDEVSTRMSRIRLLLEERKSLRAFLRGPTDPANARVRPVVRDSLDKVTQALESAITEQVVTPEPTPRVLTPETLWLTANSNLPLGGESGGQPGDVFVIVRPLGGKEVAR